MLNIHQLRDAIADVQEGAMSIDAFERWMRRASLNVHRWGDENLIEAILSVEAVLSEYHFAEMEISTAREELATAIRPFVSAELPRFPVASETSVRPQAAIPRYIPWSRGSGSVITRLESSGDTTLVRPQPSIRVFEERVAAVL